MGLRVIRFRNEKVLRNRELVFKQLEKALIELIPPLLKREGDRG
jgi:very-short-patch-repair endonuclease